jgi:hypothetical protein
MEFFLKTFKELMTELNISKPLNAINFYILCELFVELLFEIFTFTQSSNNSQRLKTRKYSDN